MFGSNKIIIYLGKPFKTLICANYCTIVHARYF